MFYRGHVRPVAWIAAGLIVLMLAAAVALILLNRPESRAYQDAILVRAGVTAL